MPTNEFVNGTYRETSSSGRLSISTQACATDMAGRFGNPIRNIAPDDLSKWAVTSDRRRHGPAPNGHRAATHHAHFN